MTVHQFFCILHISYKSVSDVLRVHSRVVNSVGWGGFYRVTNLRLVRSTSAMYQTNNIYLGDT